MLKPISLYELHPQTTCPVLSGLRDNSSPVTVNLNDGLLLLSLACLCQANKNLTLVLCWCSDHSRLHSFMLSALLQVFTKTTVMEDWSLGVFSSHKSSLV